MTRTSRHNAGRLARLVSTFDRHPWSWLFAGGVLLAASQLRFGVGVLAWIARLPFLRHARVTAGLRARLALVIASLAAWTLALGKIVTDPLPPIFAVLFALPVGALLTLPYLVLPSVRVILAVLEDHARRLVDELPPDDDLVGRVRAAIAEELTGGEPTTARIARRVAMSERTLQRRLHEHGRTVVELVDETRAAVAKAYLRDRAMSLAEIAFLLRFSDQSAFTRAFRRWTGQPPGAWRG